MRMAFRINQVFKMKIILGVLLIAVTNAVPTLKSRSGIVGGTDADLGEYPYQVLVRYGRYMCGGAIVSPNFVLTAAHCAKSQPYIYKVTAGIVDRINHESTEQTLEVEEIFIYEQYWFVLFGNDIALLKMKENFVFNEFVGPSRLPSKGDIMTGNCVATGWGQLWEEGPVSDQLQKVTVPVVPDEDCRNSLLFIQDSMICAGYEIGGKDACGGDSGGPLTCNGVVGGLTSWGIGCAEPGKPGVYTEVAYFIDWINEKINK